MEERKTTADVVIIGGGPAGMAAAFWCADLGMDAVLIEREREVGGQLLHVYNPVENYLGQRAENGREMLQHFLTTTDGSAFSRVTGSLVTSIDPVFMKVNMSDGRGISYAAMIIATGVRRRTLGVPGEVEFCEKGVLKSGSRDRSLVKGKSVLIVGGGDAALENALILSESARAVMIGFRRGVPTARDEFVAAVALKHNIQLVPFTVVNEIVGGSAVTGADLTNISTGRKWREPIDAVLFRIGVEPNSEFVRGIVRMDRRGYIIVGPNCETSIEGIFAVGDVANPIAPTLNTATGTGATAAKALHSRSRTCR